VKGEREALTREKYGDFLSAKLPARRRSPVFGGGRQWSGGWSEDCEAQSSIPLAFQPLDWRNNGQEIIRGRSFVIVVS
jgi:hypothetical protein